MILTFRLPSNTQSRFWTVCLRQVLRSHLGNNSSSVLTKRKPPPASEVLGLMRVCVRHKSVFMCTCQKNGVAGLGIWSEFSLPPNWRTFRQTAMGNVFKGRLASVLTGGMISLALDRENVN